MELEVVTRNIEDVFSLYSLYGAEDYIGEPVSQIEHMSQAAELALLAEADNEMILAAFFHDIGHLLANRLHSATMDGYGAVDHEKMGAEYLASMGFSRRMCSLIQNHVQAKRYLTLKRAGYFETLSEASLKTLTFQGGRMTPAEAALFESDPFFAEHIQLREWDEQAKRVHIPILNMGMLKEKATNLLRG